MSREKRLELIEKLENKRGTKIISFILGDRPSLETKIHSEVLPRLYKLLDIAYKGKNERPLDLILYSVGGITTAAWGIANLLNEFCSYYNVLVPYKAFSAATLICLGAREIVMTRLSQLSPVDPSVNSPFNPPVPGIQNQSPIPLLPVPVEDCVGYLNLAKKEAGIKENEGMARVFTELVTRVHPLALGSVYRAREQIKMLSEKLLMRNMEDKVKMSSIVKTVTQDLYSHDYVIGRTEASEIGLPVTIDVGIEEILSPLFEVYMDDLELTEPFNVEIESRKAEVSGSKTIIYNRAFLESTEKSYCFQTERRFEEFSVSRPGIPLPEKAIKQITIFEGWKEGSQ